MLSYFQINISIALLSFVTLLLLRRAPARLRFYICIFALSVWLVPWSLVKFPEPPEVIRTPQANLQEILSIPVNALLDFETQLRVMKKASGISEGTLLNSDEEFGGSSLGFLVDHMKWFAIGLFSLGLLMFLRDCVRYIRQHQYWLKYSKLANELWHLAGFDAAPYPVRQLQNQGPGMTTGLFKPVIWIDHAHTSADAIRTVLLHEITHIKQRDPLWLWFIIFMQHIFWWNPLIWFFSQRARQLIELSCDERCKQQLPEDDYHDNLIEIILKDHNQVQPALGIHFSRKFNIRRIEFLQYNYPMKVKHLITVCCSALLAFWVSWAVAVPHTRNIAISETEAALNEVAAGKAIAVAIEEDQEETTIPSDEVADNVQHVIGGKATEEIPGPAAVLENKKDQAVAVVSSVASPVKVKKPKPVIDNVDIPIPLDGVVIKRKNNATRVESKLAQAHALIKQKDFQPAIDALDGLEVDANSKSIETVWLLYATAYMGLKDYQQAIAWYQKIDRQMAELNLAQRASKNESYMIGFATAYILNNQAGKAVPLLTRYLENEGSGQSRDPVALSMLGSTYYGLRNYDQSILKLEQALEYSNEPELNLFLHTLLFKNHQKLKNTDLAAKAYKQIVALDPEQEKYDNTVSLLQQNKKELWKYQLKEKRWFKKKRGNDLLKIVERFKRTYEKKNIPSVSKLLLKTQEELGDKLTVAELVYALKRFGRMYRNTGDLANAAICYEHIILIPGAEQAAKVLANYDLAAIFVDARHYDKALSAYKQFMDLREKPSKHEKKVLATISSLLESPKA